MADRWRDVDIESRYFPESVEMNFHTRYMEQKFNDLSSEEKFWIAFNQETGGIPVYESLLQRSEYNRMLSDAMHDRVQNENGKLEFRTEPHGKFAKFLEYLGLREEGADWEVGDTGEAK